MSFFQFPLFIILFLTYKCSLFKTIHNFNPEHSTIPLGISKELKKIIHDLTPKETIIGNAEVRQIFKISNVGTIAGCYVTEGKIVRSKDAVLYRDGQEIFRGAIDQLKRFKDDVKEVAQGFECGISFAKWNDIEVGDIIEVSTKEEVENIDLSKIKMFKK